MGEKACTQRSLEQLFEGADLAFEPDLCIVRGKKSRLRRGRGGYLTQTPRRANAAAIKGK